MKKTILILLLALTLCASIPTLAMGWAYTPDPAPEYTVTVSKLDRVNTTAGTAYTTVPDKLAAVGQVVYFSVRITDSGGNDVAVPNGEGNALSAPNGGGSTDAAHAVIAIEEGCVWEVTGDCRVTSLSNAGTIHLNGHTITLANGTVLR